MKYVIIVMINFMMFSCATESMRLDVPDFQNKKEVYDWIIKNIKYKTDMKQYGFAEYWGSPEETLNHMAGDCDCQAILFLAIVKHQFGEKGSIIIMRYDDKSNHAVPVCGMIYDTTMHYLGDDSHYQKPYLATYTYDDVMCRAYGNH
jgi:hypothetical protein